jgi:carboxyl-terminal processing protease
MIVVLVSLSAAHGAGGTTSSSASAPGPVATTEASAADQASRLLSEGIDQALAGKFQDAQATLGRAENLDGQEPRITQAHRLLEEYVSHAAQAEAQRAQEYAHAVERVGWARMTERYFRDNASSGLEAKLREKVHQTVTAIGRSGNGDALDEAAKDSYEQLKDSSIQALTESLQTLRQTVALLGKDSGDYAEVFRRVASASQEQIEAYKQLWTQVNVADANARHAAARQLRSVEDELYDDLADLGGLTTDKPWREALGRALVAEKVAAPGDRMTEQPWHRQLIQESETRAKQFVADSQWPDALAAYASLKELEEDNETYIDMDKTVRQHVRVLRLYGPEKIDPSSAASRPSELEPTWQELVEGADAEMAEKAISQLDSYYVTAVDYAKLGRGALSAVKILAETPQVAKTFPGLADASQRQAFCQDIDSQIQALEARDRADHLDLTLALNSVLRSSERTVKIPVAALVVEFTDGFLEELDEHSSMIWPHEMADFQKQVTGHFYGVGIQITKEPGEPLRVVTPLANSPALKAGLKPGDLILAVDSRATEDIGVDKLVRMITGEKGTKVTLRIKRAGRVEPFDVTLTRQEINIISVCGWQTRPDGRWDYRIDPEGRIAYVRILQFTDQTADDLHAVLAKLTDSGIRLLVLDLRFNLGGLLHSATDVADEFLRRGRLVSTEGRQTRRQDINAKPSGEYLDGDLVVLVNQASASAAEIVSGAIKDWRRGLIVGQRTYGKGSVQNVIPIRRGRADLKLTTAYYYLPSGRLLHRRNGQKDWGVDPDIEVRMTPKQLKRWLEVRQKTDLLREVDPAELRGDLARQFDADIQLATAVLLLRLKQLQESPATFTPPTTASLEPAQP